MPMRFAASTAAYYVNLRLNLKMDLPTRRETVLGLFDRLRRQRPNLARFRRYQNELALESDGPDGGTSERPAQQEWVAVRRTSVRAGSVCPREWDDAYTLHTAVIEAAPYYLDISALDIDSVEVLLGFDLAAGGNHDAIVCEALMSGTPLAGLAAAEANGVMAQGRRAAFVPVDCQPVFGVALDESLNMQAHVEVKTRSAHRPALAAAGSGSLAARQPGGDEPISLYLIVRRFGPFSDIAHLPAVLGEIRVAAHDLLDRFVEPKVLSPIRDHIVAGGWS